MKKNNLLENSSDHLQKTDSLKKDYEEKKRLASDYYDLLIYSINKEALFRRQFLKKLELEAFEKNISHALALLKAAKDGLKNNGPTPFTDYLVSSALSHIAEHLPEASVKKILDRLDEFNKNNNITNPSSSNSETSAKQKDSDRPSNKSHKKNIPDKSFNELISRVSTTLLTPNYNTSSPIKYDNRILIDFAADKLPYRKYGTRCAMRLGASLIQVNPNRFSAVNESFSISKNTLLTIIGHCNSGSDHLEDNSGNRIYASQLAEQIYLKMNQNGTSLDTEFNIDLIACQAASAGRGNPSFAQQLANELSIRGISNVNVIASPTIMLATHDGSQANLTVEEDRKFVERSRSRLRHVNNFVSSFHFFGSPCQPKLNIGKVAFRSNLVSPKASN